MSFTVDAAAFPDSVRHRLEIYVRIPPVTVAALTRDANGEGRVKLAVRLQNRFGAKQHDAVQEFSVAAGDSAPGFGKVVVLPFPVQPGRYRMAVKLEDLLSRRRGISYVGRRVAESGAVEGEVSVPAEHAGRELSDLEFVWRKTGRDPKGPARDAKRSFPIPSALRSARESARGRVPLLAPRAEPRPWHGRAAGLDTNGAIVAESESTVTAAPWLTETVGIDMATQPAGGYDLELKVWMEGDSAALTRHGHFSVAWQPSSWLRSPAELEDIVHFLLEADNEENFARMQLGSRAILDEFWKRRDRRPGRRRREHVIPRRGDKANRKFGRSASAGNVLGNGSRLHPIRRVRAMYSQGFRRDQTC